MDGLTKEIWEPSDPILFTIFGTILEPQIYTISGYDEKDIAGQITITPFTNYKGVIVPETDMIILNEYSNRLEVVLNDSNAFPIEYIKFLDRNGEIKIGLDWKDLPSDAPELIEYRPTDNRTIIYTLNVTAEIGIKKYETSYSMIFIQDWTSGRNRLLEEVNARRS